MFEIGEGVPLPPSSPQFSGCWGWTIWPQAVYLPERSGKWYQTSDNNVCTRGLAWLSKHHFPRETLSAWPSATIGMNLCAEQWQRSCNRPTPGDCIRVESIWSFDQPVYKDENLPVRTFPCWNSFIYHHAWMNKELVIFTYIYIYRTKKFWTQVQLNTYTSYRHYTT